MTTSTTRVPATVRQIAFLRVLAYERLMMETEAIDKMNLDRFTTSEASSLIDEWTKLPKQRSAPAPVWGSAPAGSASAPHTGTGGLVITGRPAPNPAVRTWDCFKCGEVFSSWTALSQHKVTRHSGASTPAPAPTRTSSAALATSGYAKITLPKGRYAVELAGEWRFYRVTETSYGRGTYLRMTRQSGDNFVPLRPSEVSDAQDAIKAMGERLSMEEYGKRIGRCGCCGRTLTDPLSRSLGIGPDCRGSRGWS